MFWFEDLILRSKEFEDANTDRANGSFEENIEWSEFDEVFQHFFDYLLIFPGVYYRLLHMFFRLVA